MEKVILLARVSTDQQDYTAQISELREYIKLDGYSENQIIEISGHESALLDAKDRHTLTEMYEYIKTENVKAVYCTELTRLSRKGQILNNLFYDFIDKKIDLRIMDKNIRLFNKDGEVDEGTRWQFSIYITLCDSEGRIRAERFARGKKAKAELGHFNGGKVKFGYTTDVENNYIIDPINGKIVQKIFNLYAEGHLGINQLYKKIQLECTLFPETIGRILNEPLYTGQTRESFQKTWYKLNKLTSKKEPVTKTYYKRAYPAIITKELFEKCREISIRNNTNVSKSKTVYYAHRLIICDVCGDFLQPFKTKDKTMYRCYNRYPKHDKQKKCTSNDSININVVDFLSWMVAKELEAKRIKEFNQSEIEKYQNQIEEYRSIINNSENVFDNHLQKKIKELSKMGGDFSDKELKNMAIRMLSDIKKKMDNENSRLDTEITRINQMLTDMVSNYESMGMYEKSKLKRSEINKIADSIEQSTENDDLKRREIIRRNIAGIRIYNEPKRIKRIDIWINSDDGGCSLVPSFYYYAFAKEKEKRLYVMAPKTINNVTTFEIVKYIDYTERFKIN